MCKKALLGAITVSMLIVSQITVAQAAGPGPGPGPGSPPDARQYPPNVRQAVPPPPPRAYAPQQRPEAYKRPPPPRGYNRYRFSDSWRGSHGHFRPGYTIPSYSRRGYDRYVINDWRRYSLYAPPPGHRWLLVDGNFVLAAISTGIIAQILLAH